MSVRRAFAHCPVRALAAVTVAASGIAFAQAPVTLTFADQANVFAARQITSAPVTISGLAGPAPVTVSGGTFSIGCGALFGSTPGVIAEGESVCVRHLSSAAPGGTASTVLTVGAATGTFTSTTSASSAAAMIAGYYRAILRREADPGGQAHWESEFVRLQPLGIDVNETWRAMAIAFFESAEYRAFGRSDAQFVVDLYNTFLGRPPDAAGLAHWTGEIALGIPRPAAIVGFLFSAEFANYTSAIFGAVPTRGESDMVVDFYRGLLIRLPDTGGFGHWRSRFRQAQCLGRAAVLAEVEAISTLFLASAEYLGRNRTNLEYLADLYNAFLRRGGELEGIRYWSGQLDSGAQSREQVRRAFMNGPEFRARVALVADQPCLAPLSLTSGLFPGAANPGPSPFIAFVDLLGNSLDRITSVRFTVSPKAGSASRPVKVSYSGAHLVRTGHATLPLGPFRVPVFGLYSGHDNEVSLDVAFDDGSVRNLVTRIVTAPYTDPAGIYDRPSILTRRLPGTPLGFDFMYLKSGLAWPVIIDTDGEIRWAIPGTGPSFSSTFDGTGFVAGDRYSLRLTRIGLDGSLFDYALQSSHAYFHHEMAPGKFGILGEVDEYVGGLINYENILVEFGNAGEVIKQWDFAAILSSHMISNGDDPSPFITLGIDWFHMNSAIYDPSDDSLIVSSRENFVIKVDYQTGRPIWILGDPTKYWYTLPSLRAISLVVPDGGLYPIGQHAMHLLPDGRLLLFNNGMPSFNQPAGGAPGELRSYSAVSAYTIDPVAKTARESWRFDYGGSIFSRFCSSAYTVPGAMFITYSSANGGASARLVGIDEASRVIFDFDYASTNCRTAWNAEPIEFHDLVID